MPDHAPEWLAGHQAAVDEIVEALPAMSAIELARITATLTQMPAPRGEQPRSVLLSVRAPRLGGDVVIGTMSWEATLLEWTWQPGPIIERPAGLADYPFRDEQPRPNGVIATGGRRS